MSINRTVIAVTSVTDKENMVRKLVTRLQADPVAPLAVIHNKQDSTIKVFHKTGVTQVLIHTYIVVIIPINISYESIVGFGSNTYLHLDNVIDKLISIIKHLQALSTRSQTKGDSNDGSYRETLRQLVGILREADGEHRVC